MSKVIADRDAGGNVAANVVASNPYAVAANRLAAARHAATRGPVPLPGTDEEQILSHALSTTIMQVHRNHLDVKGVAESVRRFSNQDPEFVIQCTRQFIEWYLVSAAQYRSWVNRPDGKEFGVITYVLPPDARVVLIGDWGTGMPDAARMLTALLAQTHPTAIIHLGDVYYSGTPDEAKFNFLDVVDRCCSDAGLTARLPTYAIPGNHDYYSGGLGFYNTIDAINAGDQRQPASYFCLRTSDQRWQFLGLDTGHNDHVPGLPFEPFYRAPGLQDSEVEWAKDKLRGFAGQTLMLTHHQLFSARSPMNGPLSFRPANLNSALLDAFAPHFSKIAAWFWGHEHSLALFRDGLFRLRKGRLLGCSAFETPVGDGYDRVFQDIDYERPVAKLGIESQWLNHGCACIDLGEQVIQYFQFPSWAATGSPPDPQLTLLAREALLGGRL